MKAQKEKLEQRSYPNGFPERQNGNNPMEIVPNGFEKRGKGNDHGEVVSKWRKKTKM